MGRPTTAPTVFDRFFLHEVFGSDGPRGQVYSTFSDIIMEGFSSFEKILRFHHVLVANLNQTFALQDSDLEKQVQSVSK